MDAQEWDDFYRGDPPPVFDIGRPQPNLAHLLRRFDGEILDAGCGYGDLSIAIAEQGNTVVGLDISTVAISCARAKADQRRLDTVTFEQADLRELSGYDDQFSVVIDCGCLSSLQPEERPNYMNRLVGSAVSDAQFYIMARAGTGDGNDGMVETQLVELLSPLLNINSIMDTTVRINRNVERMFHSFIGLVRDGDGYTLPAFLVSASKSKGR